MDAVFYDAERDDYWKSRIVAVPERGSTIILDAAPKGVVHKVTNVIHRIGGGEHRISVLIKRINDPEIVAKSLIV